MNCHDYAAALLEGLPPSPGARVHGRECPRCQALAQLHGSARALGLAEPPAAASIPYQSILAEVRRRQRRRQRVAGVGVTAALVLLAVLFTTRGTVSPPVSGVDASAGVAVEGSARIVQPSSDGASRTSGEGRPFASLGALLTEVGGYSRTVPGLADAMYQPFGGLAFWVHAPESEALAAEPFQTALAALAVSRSPQAVE